MPIGHLLGQWPKIPQCFCLTHEATIQNYLANSFITWHFTPLYNPHFEGLWKSSIKLAKRYLLKILDYFLMTFEELSIFMCAIEACINSRPLTSLSNNPKDLHILTSRHFLMGSSLLQLPSFTTGNPSNSTYSFFLQIVLSPKAAVINLGKVATGILAMSHYKEKATIWPRKSHCGRPVSHDKYHQYAWTVNYWPNYRPSAWN